MKGGKVVVDLEWPQAEYKLQWACEFEGPGGSRPDPATWNFDLGDGSQHGIPGWGNSEREYYMESAAELDGASNLVITASRLPADNPHEAYYGTPAEWSSAKLHTFGKVHFQYGRVEGRLWMPSGLGTWPAFWMLGTNIAEVSWPQCGEIDIAEARGDMPNTLFSTLHGPGYFGDHGLGRPISAPFELSGGYHTYTLDWLPGKIRWLLDGVECGRRSAPEAAPLEWVFDHEFYLIVNLAMGGHFTGPIDPELNEAVYKLDHIRHYSIDGVGTATLL